MAPLYSGSVSVGEFGLVVGAGYMLFPYGGNRWNTFKKQLYRLFHGGDNKRHFHVFAHNLLAQLLFALHFKPFAGGLVAK